VRAVDFLPLIRVPDRKGYLGQLHRELTRLAAVLKKLGVNKGMRVVI
jgi:acyl-coenzyme A synthetase/AMP-(fatty) acid ligase